MVKELISIILQVCSLVTVIIAAGLWTLAGIDTRPKYRDEQTLVGGTIWSQLIIPLGLLLSKIVNESVDTFIHGYFLLTGVGLCTTTGILLIVEEIKAMKRPRRTTLVLERINRSKPLLIIRDTNSNTINYDRLYLGIGILSLLTGFIIFAQFLIIIT